jgi:SAM-dependent methyltransferase
MAHKQQSDFCNYVRFKFPEKFTDVRVLDMGSLDINGNNRYLFTGDYSYIGVDIGPGKNVDVICRGHKYESDEMFDVVISTECFEHDEFYALTLKKMYDLLKPGGVFIFTCATTGRPEHGTTRTSPADAPFIGDYYKNLNEKDVREVMNIENVFSEHQFISREVFPQDLYFYGIKKENPGPEFSKN